MRSFLLFVFASLCWGQTGSVISGSSVLVGPSVMPATSASSAPGVTTNNTINLTVSGSTAGATLGSTPTVGHTILVGAHVENGTGWTSCTDNQTPANTYTKYGDVAMNTNVGMALFAAPVTTASGTFTVTCTPVASSGNMIIGLADVTGVVSSSPQDGATINNFTTFGSGISCSSGSGITTTNATDIIFSFFMSTHNPVTLTAGGSGTFFTNAANIDDSALMYQLTSVTGTYNPSATMTPTTNLYCIAAAFK